MGLLTRIKNAPSRWKNRARWVRDKLTIGKNITKDIKPEKETKNGDDDDDKKKGIDYKKWLTIGNALAKLAGGTDYSQDIQLKAGSYSATSTKGDSASTGYIIPRTSKKKKKKGGY